LPDVVIERLAALVELDGNDLGQFVGELIVEFLDFGALDDERAPAKRGTLEHLGHVFSFIYLICYLRID